MAIEWNKVTRLSQLVAIILFVGVFGLGFWLGIRYQAAHILLANPGTTRVGESVIANASYQCDAGKAIIAAYRERSVSLSLSDGRDLTLPQTLSASGIRYANEDESFVFWSKGNTAFITEGTDKGDTMIYANCVEAPIPQ